MSTTFQNELMKIFGNDAVFDDTRYVGRACMGSLAPDIRAKAEFIATKVSDHYDALRVHVINRHEGEIDAITIRFKELWGNKPVPGNPNFKNGVEPHMWKCDGKLEWYAYRPTQSDINLLQEELQGYTEMFRDRSMEMEQGGMQMG